MMAIKTVAYASDVVDGKVLIQDSEGGQILSSNPKELLDFLTRNYGDSNTLNRKVCWNLDRFISVVIKRLGLDIAKQLCVEPDCEAYFSLDGSGTATYDLKDKPKPTLPESHYAMYYHRKTSFGIQSGNLRRSYFYNLSQFFEDDDSEIPEPKDILAKATELVNAFFAMGLNPLKMSSPVSVYQSSVLEHSDFPTLADLPSSLTENQADELADWCEEIMHREWTTCLAVGRWLKGETWDYDVQCYSDDTECLTINGWKYIKDLTLGELILGFNPKKERCRFQPVQQLHRSFYHGEMRNIENTKISLCVTPNHRILLQDHIRSKAGKYYKTFGHYGYTDWIIRTAGEMPNGNCKLPVSFPIIDKPDYPMPDNLLRLIAWINTEGRTTANRNKNGKHINGIEIRQSENANPEYCKEIDQILNSLSLTYTNRTTNEPYHHKYALIKGRIYAEKASVQNMRTFRIWATSLPRILPHLENNIHLIPLWILQQCSLRQLKIYFNTLIKGDGSRQKDGDGNTCKLSFCTKLPENKDKMMYLCHLLGYKVSYKNPDKSHPTYQIFIINDGRKTPPHNQHLQHGDVKITHHSGSVVCPTIEDGFLVIRRNNKSCICGNSSYGNQVAHLYNFKYAEFRKSREWWDEAHWGVVKGRITIYPNAKCSPICYKKENGQIINPVGYSWYDKFPVPDIRFIRKRGIGEFELDEGYFWRYTAPVAPFKIPMQRVFSHRQQRGLVKKLAKRIGASAWGKFIQRAVHGEINKWYNPVFGLQVKTGARLQVANFIYDNALQDFVLHIGTDGVRATKHIATPDKVELGAWKLNEQDSCIILSPGRIYTPTHKPGGLYYQDLIDLIQTKPNESYYSAKKTRRLTLGEALEIGDLDKVGELHEFEISVDLIAASVEQDLDFSNGFPTTGKELLEKKYFGKPTTMPQGRL